MGTSSEGLASAPIKPPATTDAIIENKKKYQNSDLDALPLKSKYFLRQVETD